MPFASSLIGIKEATVKAQAVSTSERRFVPHQHVNTLYTQPSSPSNRSRKAIKLREDDAEEEEKAQLSKGIDSSEQDESMKIDLREHLAETTDALMDEVMAMLRNESTNTNSAVV